MNKKMEGKSEVGWGLLILAGIISAPSVLVYGGTKLEQRALEKTRQIIPITENLQIGSIDPSKLSIGLIDPDMNGQDEVAFRYNGESYLARVDESGIPYFEPLESAYRGGER